MSDQKPFGTALGETPITDTLNNDERGMLTAAASKFTEREVLLNNWAMAGKGESPIPQITWEDMKSLEKAFIARDQRLYGLDGQSGGMSAEPEGSDCCCCCCPASCCSAAAEVRPARSRRVFV